MSHWNHRVIKKVYRPSGEESYGVHEVFYNDDGSIYSYTVNPVDAACETLDDLREYIQWMLNCLDKPVLIDGEIDCHDPHKDDTEEEYESFEDFIASFDDDDA